MKEDNTSPVAPQGKREPGYYWVNSDFKKEHRPRYWNGNLWFIGMDVYVKDDFWLEIDERRIERGPDIELLGLVKEGREAWEEIKKEIAERDKRIKELEAALNDIRGPGGLG